MYPYGKLSAALLYICAFKYINKTHSKGGDCKQFTGQAHELSLLFFPKVHTELFKSSVSCPVLIIWRKTVCAPNTNLCSQISEMCSQFIKLCSQLNTIFFVASGSRFQALCLVCFHTNKATISPC